jgi:4-hydroxy-tetrahydrodipicolinate synthase
VHQRLYPLFRDLFCEPSPAPIKHAMRRAGIISTADVRLPLAPLSPAGRETLEATLDKLGV